MAAKPIRNNAYYLRLFERDHLAVFRDYHAGKYPTVAEALIVAGIKSKRTPLQELLNAWKKASPAERDAFQHAVGGHMPGATAAAPAAPTRVPFSLGKRLEPDAVKAAKDKLVRRRLRMGDLMAELGRKRLNASLGLSLSKGSCLQQDLIDDLEAWVARH